MAKDLPIPLTVVCQVGLIYLLDMRHMVRKPIELSNKERGYGDPF